MTDSKDFGLQKGVFPTKRTFHVIERNRYDDLVPRKLFLNGMETFMSVTKVERQITLLITEFELLM